MTAAIYIRKSREDKTKPAHRLTAQRQQLPAHARAQGWTPIVYDDGYASAARGKTEDLTERSRLESDVRAGKIDIILTIELSRLSRDDSMQDYTAWLHLCGQHGVKLATLSRVLDPAQHSDWMLLLMEGGFSSVEMRVLQARMAEGRAEAIRAGKYISGRPPRPYINDKGGQLTIDPDQLETVQQILTLAETNSVHRIAKLIDLPEITIRRTISDERLLFYQGKRLDPDTGTEVDAQWPAIIDDDQAQRIRAARRTRKPYSKTRESGGLLSNLDGLLQCGYCNHTAKAWRNSRTKKDGTRNNYYGCSHSCGKSRLVQQDVVDTRVITNLLGTLSNIDALRDAWQHYKNSGDVSIKQLDALEREVQDLTTKKQRLIAAISEGVITFADAKQSRQQIEAALGSIHQRRTQIIGSRQPEPKWDELQINSEEWDALSQPEQRKLLKLNLRRVTLYYSYAIIEYTYPRDTKGSHIARIHLPEPYKSSTRKPRATKRNHPE